MSLTVLSVAYPFAPVGPDSVGGAEQILTTLDKALVERGGRSIVIATQGSATAGEFVRLPRPDGAIGDRERRLAWSHCRAAIARVTSKENIDVIHLHGIDFHEYLPATGNCLVTLHLPLSWYPAQCFQSRPGLFYNCVSQAQENGSGNRKDRLPPIGNGVDLQVFRETSAKRGYALMLGRICPEKGMDVALDAARLADVPLIIGGELFPYEAHQRYFEEEVRPRLDERRRFVGPLGLDRKRRLLAEARCVLIPSRAAETSSLVAMEAIASGTPVIAFPNGALAEIVEDGRTGFLVENAEEMAQAMGRCSSINSRDCRAAAEQRFSLQAMTSGYFAAYDRICAAA